MITITNSLITIYKQTLVIKKKRITITITKNSAIQNLMENFS